MSEAMLAALVVLTYLVVFAGGALAGISWAMLRYYQRQARKISHE